MTNDSLPVLFILHPKTKEELVDILEQNFFKYPIFIDEDDIFNKLNRFSDDVRLQTFLLDKEQKIVAFGNPILNPQIKEFYLKIILGNSMTKQTESKLTEARIYKSLVTLGKFHWEKELQSEFVLTNTGVNPLVIVDVSTSCGCTSVEYSKEPVKPGGELKLIVKYKADEPGHFSKSIKVFCNTKDSPISLKITGEALAH